MLWELFLPDAKSDFQHAQAKYNADRRKWRADHQEWEARQNGAQNNKDKEPTEPVPPRPRMHANEPQNFCRFAAVLKLMLGSSVLVSKLPRIHTLLEEYLLGFREVCIVLMVRFRWIADTIVRYMVLPQ